eukprot:scaffold334779_cov20-Prasinocladus_malaysianus.AAC.1
MFWFCSVVRSACWCAQCHGIRNGVALTQCTFSAVSHGKADEPSCGKIHNSFDGADNFPVYQQALATGMAHAKIGRVCRAHTRTRTLLASAFTRTSALLIPCRSVVYGSR